MPETADQVCDRPEVKKELRRTGREATSRDKVKARATDKFWFVTHALLLLGCAVLYYLIGLKIIPLSPAHTNLAYRLIRGAALIVIVLEVAKAVRVYAIGRIDDRSEEHTSELQSRFG